MKIIVAAVLNGALVFATAAGFLALRAGVPTHEWAIAAYLSSLGLAASCAFVSIGGLDAVHAHRGRDGAFCAALAGVWTGVLAVFALALISSLLASDWLSLGAAKAWLLGGAAAQAVLLALLARTASRLPGRDFELK